MFMGKIVKRFFLLYFVFHLLQVRLVVKRTLPASSLSLPAGREEGKVGIVMMMRRILKVKDNYMMMTIVMVLVLYGNYI